ncbi:hypothetical protein A2U01_0079447, partial [Trifolium medium]|nr:hypothetical protein [Trifolium medium]
ESTSQKGDKDKRPTKVTASAMRKNAAENPPKKRSQKLQAEAAETAHPVPEHHEGEPAQADDMDEGHYGHDGDHIVHEMEEEIEREVMEVRL